MRILGSLSMLSRLVASAPGRAMPSTRLFSAMTDILSANAFCSIRDWLRPSGEESSQRLPREVLGAHFCSVKPEPCPAPYLIAASAACLRLLGLPENSASDPDFAKVFSGNKLVPGLDAPYVTNYGCHR